MRSYINFVSVRVYKSDIISDIPVDNRLNKLNYYSHDFKVVNNTTFS